MELALLRKSVGALTRARAALRALPPDAADRRARLPLRRGGWCASCAGRCAARRPRAPSSCTRRSTTRGARPRAPPDTRRPLVLRRPWTPSSVNVTIDRPREEVFEYLADIANHPEFTRPLPQGLAPDAGRLLRPRRRARASASDAPLHRFGWGDMTFIEVERAAPDRRRRPRRQVQPHQDVRRAGRSSRAGGGTRVEFMFETEPALPTDRFIEALGVRAAGSSASGGKALRRLQSILEEDERPRRARHRRRALDSRAVDDAAACSSSLPSWPPRSLVAGCGNKDETSHGGRDRGHLHRRRRPQVPGPDLALPQPGRRRGPRRTSTGLPAGTLPADRPTRSGSASGCGSRTRRDKTLPAGRRSSRSSTPRATCSGRSRSPDVNPFAYQADRRSAPASVAPGPELAGRRAARSRARCSSSSSRPTSLAEPPARVPHHDGPTGRGRRHRRPRRLAQRGLRCTVLAAGAAVSPPAPWPTSSTATATRGCWAGAKAANQASVSVLSSSGGGVASAPGSTAAGRR